MATAKQIVVRLAPEDEALLAAIQAHTGHLAVSETIRFVLRQYAKANDIAAESRPKPKRKP